MGRGADTGDNTVAPCGITMRSKCRRIGPLALGLGRWLGIIGGSWAILWIVVAVIWELWH